MYSFKIRTALATLALSLLQLNSLAYADESVAPAEAAPAEEVFYGMTDEGCTEVTINFEEKSLFVDRMGPWQLPEGAPKGLECPIEMSMSGRYVISNYRLASPTDASFTLKPYPHEIGGTGFGSGNVADFGKRANARIVEDSKADRRLDIVFRTDGRKVHFVFHTDASHMAEQ